MIQKLYVHLNSIMLSNYYIKILYLIIISKIFYIFLFFIFFLMSIGLPFFKNNYVHLNYVML